MAKSPVVILYDASGNPVSIISDSGVYRASTIGKVLNASGAQINPATEDGKLTTLDTTLTAIKNTDGVKKIVDALPTGANSIGKIGDLEKWIGSAAPTIGQKTMGNSIPTVIASNQSPIPIYVSASSNNFSKMVTLFYNASIGAVVAGAYRRVYNYTVPTGFNGYLIRFSSFQAEVAQSRLVSEINFGTLNIATNVFVADAAYSNPQWSGISQAEVTTALSSGAGDVTVTVTYTNCVGTAGRTGTITIPKGSLLESRWNVVLQTGDLGIRSIQNLSVAPTLAAGAIKVLGFIQLGYHEDGGTTSLETPFAPGAIVVPPETKFGIEFQGNLVSKVRRFDFLLQLTDVI